MPSSSKPRHKRNLKKITGRRSLRTKPWKTASVFAPLEAIIDQLESEGTLTVVAKGEHAGKPVFQMPGEIHWHVAAPALRGLIETLEIHEKRSGRTLPLEPLRKLATKFEIDMPIFEADTQAVRAAMAVLIEVSNGMDCDYADSLVQVTRTSIAFEKLNSPTQPHHQEQAA